VSPSLARVAIVHPWLPQYRLQFFETLVKRAPEFGAEITVFHGAPPPDVRGRLDAVESSRFIETPSRLRREIGGLVWKDGRAIRAGGPWDAVILEQAVRNLESYPWFAQRSTPVAFWGHGRTYTKRVPVLQERLKEALTLRTKWFFAYTDGGRRHLEHVGYDPSRITVVNNTIDVRKLESALDQLDPQAVVDVRSQLKAAGPVLTFIGGLDNSKRIDFLLTAVEHLSKILPLATVVIAGAGPLRESVSAHASGLPNLRLLPPKFGDEKAALLAASDYLLMPGRVGLVVMDSFATGTPIVTTDWPFHAPEFEYLTPGMDSIVTRDDPFEYAMAVRNALQAPAQSQLAMRNAARSAASEFSIEDMSRRFLAGLRDFLRTERKMSYKS
jgi:glycosyltransferase involved in cell wall biosynthesis